jgi:hypothetical protein
MMAMWAETCLHEIMIKYKISVVNYILFITLYYCALTLSLPAGHICPTGHEKVNTVSYNTVH